MKLTGAFTQATLPGSCGFLRNVSRTLGRQLFIVAGAALIAGCTTHSATHSKFVAGAHLPTNAKMTCEADISPWFGGDVTANGKVQPANGLDPIFADFANNSRCDFYKWGAQMFLWLTSGVGDKRVFNSSPVFYNISLEENNQRSFLPGNGPMLLAVRKQKTDSETELGQAGVGDVLLSQKGSLVYYGIHVNDVYALYTTGQKTGALVLEKDIACAVQFENCAVEIAGEIAGYCKQQLTSCLDGDKNSTFPSTPGQLQAVSEFAESYGYPLPDIKAMALELKTSWIDAATLTEKDQKDYVLSQAVVPVFDRSKAKGPWPVIGNVEKTLALVGMHVVGTVNGHPEMIWSTFEHVNNAPNNTYAYTTAVKKDGKGEVAIRTYDSHGDWNFIESKAKAPTAITANAKISTNTGSSQAQSIVSIGGADISPVNVMRVDAWGNKQNDIANNTDLISINVSVLSQLKAGDVRGNYIQTGGIWSAEGQIPPGVSQASPSYTSPPYLRGSLNLANGTMETFYQFQTGTPSTFNPVNCFGCHGTIKAATEVSHIFGDLQPLPRKK